MVYYVTLVYISHRKCHKQDQGSSPKRPTGKANLGIRNLKDVILTTMEIEMEKTANEKPAIEKDFRHGISRFHWRKSTTDKVPAKILRICDGFLLLIIFLVGNEKEE